MCTLMIPKRAAVCKLLAARATRERLFARMSSHVYLQRRRPLELHVADLTAELRSAHVNLQVLFQIARLHELLVADKARVRFNAVVAAHV